MIANNSKYNSFLLVCVSAILVFIAVLKVNFLLAWFCYVPLFLVLIKDKTKTYKPGITFGVTLSVLSFYWMVAGAQRFTGSSNIYGLIVSIISAIILTAYWLILFTLFKFFKRTEKKIADAVANAFIASALWIAGEVLLAVISTRMPWFLFRTGMSVSNNLYAIQPVAFFGVNIASFVVVFVNYLFAYFISAKKYKLLYIPALVILFYTGTGYFLFTGFNNQPSTLKAFKAAVLTENTSPEIKWNDTSGNELVNRLLNLAKQSTGLKPDIDVWTESTVPWTYRPDDDFVNEVLRITKPANITHVMGINSDSKSGSTTVYNSAYSILPDGKVESRYDKRYLLSFIEHPFANIIFPFLSSAGYVVEPGTSAEPLQTPYGNAGILLCNESAVSSAAADLVKNNAQFICNMSNDGWFSDTYIATQHFYNARLRAVETRKDVIVNSNDGITGLVKASGEIVNAERNSEPVVTLQTIQPNNYKTLSTTSPDIILYISLLIIAISFFIKSKSNNNNLKV